MFSSTNNNNIDFTKSQKINFDDTKSNIKE